VVNRAVTTIKRSLNAALARRRLRRARLPWAELEAEARRQGCSPADIFFDRAGTHPRSVQITSSTRQR
jgi:hypothetical protein